VASYYYKKKIKRRVSPIRRLFGSICIVAAFGVAFYFFFPIVSFQIYIASVFASGTLQTPLPSDLLTTGVSSLTTDYEDARNWFPKVQTINKSSTVDSYTLSIPKIKIINAIVSTKNYNLSQNLIHYWDTVSPGQKGTTVIIGHSSLPQFYSPGNYRTIFANLHRIKEGDEIELTVGDTIYKYRVYGTLITEPDDTAIFAQNSDNSYLTVVTCTPPGTVWKRLIVRAKLFEAVH